LILQVRDDSTEIAVRGSEVNEQRAEQCNFQGGCSDLFLNGSAEQTSNDAVLMMTMHCAVCRIVAEMDTIVYALGGGDSFHL
jgi:hypothetical protein